MKLLINKSGQHKEPIRTQDVIFAVVFILVAISALALLINGLAFL